MRIYLYPSWGDQTKIPPNQKSHKNLPNKKSAGSKAIALAVMKKVDGRWTLRFQVGSA